MPASGSPWIRKATTTSSPTIPPTTWSQKYNLVWDQILGYNLFPKSLRDSEIAFYKTKINKFGLPLDSREDYTKLDRSIWTATPGIQSRRLQRYYGSHRPLD
ncbi:glutaminase domain-containing protein [Acidisarcina polymorpha]|uniref:glutaminase domain-containing protein n=1 Tax=Acidisarcina polymorpha TaxID=2211140 RepID=UPI0023AAFED0|nr:DUF1793 domain-containing protein [Acidisarcina polymorpha]